MNEGVVQELKDYLKYKMQLAIMFTYDSEKQKQAVKYLSNISNLKDYNEFINGVLEDAPDIANDIGTRTMEQFGLGMTDNIFVVGDAADEIMKGAEKNLDSMVKKFKQYGSDSVDGLISGIDERKKDLTVCT